MAEKSFPLDNVLYSAEDMQLYLCTRSSGVYTLGTNLLVSAGTGMGVSVDAGIAWLHYDTFRGAVFGNTAAKALTIATAHTTYARIDRVVVRYDATANTIALAVKQGTPAVNPSAPALSRTSSLYEISLSRVLVGAGATAIAAGNITDERADAAVCGLMTDGTTSISVTLAGAATGAITANTTAAASLGTAQMRNIHAGTGGMTPGSTALATGAVYLQYE